MKFHFYFHKTALYLAVERENIDIALLLLECADIDTNIICILKQLFIKFLVDFINSIKNSIIKSHLNM